MDIPIIGKYSNELEKEERLMTMLIIKVALSICIIVIAVYVFEDLVSIRPTKQLAERLELDVACIKKDIQDLRSGK